MDKKRNKSDKILFKITQMMKIPVILIFIGIILSAATIYAQQERRITGTVVDDRGETIIGASVVERGTSNGTATNIDGQFTLTVQPNAVLQISYLGYATQEIPVGSRTTINVTMLEDTRMLDEVVVTALGISRERKALGYAVSDIRADDIVASNTINPVLALQGKAAGVNISASNGGLFGSSRIQIRGVSTLSNNTQPIFVVDGIILANSVHAGSEWNTSTNDFGNQLKNLNPDDFESVTILKGAAATALYGSRGLHGAVVITTKRGERRAGLGISISQTVGIDYVYGGPDFQYEFGPGQYAGGAALEREQNRFLTTNFGWTGEEDQVGERTLRRMPRSEFSGNWGPAFDGQLIEDYNGRMIPYSPNRSHFTDAFDTGFNTTTNISIQGADENTTFYLSDTYTKRTGWSPTNTFERNSLMLKASRRLSSFLNVEASVNLNNSTSINPPFGLANNFARNLFKNIYDTKYYKDQWRTSHGGAPSTEARDPNALVPGIGTWWNINNRTDMQKQIMVLPIVRLTANIKDFTIVGEGNMNLLYTLEENKALGSGYNNEGTTNDAGGHYNLRQILARNETFKLSAAYQKSLGDFNLGGTFGGEWYLNKGSINLRTQTNGGLVAPGQYFIGNTRNLVSGNYSGTHDGFKRIYSFYFLANASWRNQLYLDITGRNDWSSALVYSNGTGNYSYFYPSVSGSWLFHETFDLPDWFTFGKLRASWAQVGNDTTPYSINQTYSAGSTSMPNGSLVQHHSFSRMVVDPNLRPERKNSFEVGADLFFAGNRIGFEATYYKENTTDQIVTVPAPLESGITSQRINAGNIQNQGVELVLKTTPIKSQFQWDLNVMYAKNKNKIVELHPSIGEYLSLVGAPTSGDFRIGAVAYIGGEYGTLLSDAMPKVDNKGNKVLTWNDGEKSAYYARSGVVERIGKQDPDFTGSITNVFSYKGFFANVLIDVRWGGYIGSYTNLYARGYGVMKNSLQYRNSQYGGLTFTSMHAEKEYATFHDGFIPDGVFDSDTWATLSGGRTVTLINDQGEEYESRRAPLAGLTYQQAIDKGWIEPMHGSTWHYRNNEWNTFTINDGWFNEMKYIALRHITFGYTVPNRFTFPVGISNLRLSIEAHNVRYLYNSLPNNLNPESMSGNSNNYMYYERIMQPFIASYNFTVRFNL